jgi:DNA-directed RNA polymerase subunit RPC12/RpoP
MRLKKSSLLAHRELFGTQEACLTFLANEKWDKGFVCKSCGHREYIKGRVKMDRRCKLCKRNESPTSGTLFHSIKIPLVIAFEIVYRVSVNKKGLSALSISREYHLNQKTGILIRDKIQRAMQSSGKNPLTGLIHVDEFSLGGPEENKQGRSLDSKKKKAVMAVEILGAKPIKKKNVGRLYIQKIKDFSSKELKKIFDTRTDKTAQIETDKWSSYKVIKKEYPLLTQKYSQKGSAFKELHIMVMNFKSWIKGIHHRISERRYQYYLDEFVFRFNRRNTIENIAIHLLAKMTKSKPLAIINKS